MSIIIKSEELNVLIYKYLLESNLHHSAFTFYHEALLERVLSQYKYDVKAGHLLALLEKALIFTQIENHTTISEYEECLEPVRLLKPHTCSISTRIKAENEKLMEDYNEQIYNTMRRTSSVHNTLVPNKDYEEIVYDHRSKNYLDRVTLQVHDIGEKELVIKGNSQTLLFYDYAKYNLMVLKVEQDRLLVHGILPCMFRGKPTPLMQFHLINNTLARVFEGNICEIVEIGDEGFHYTSCFQVPLMEPITGICENERVSSLIAFRTGKDYCIINSKKQESVHSGLGMFQWRLYDQFITYSQQMDSLVLRSLRALQPMIKFNTYMKAVSKMEVSASKIYFLVESQLENMVCVYTFEKEEPIYIFNIHDQMHDEVNGDTSYSEPEQLKQSLWVTANDVDYLVMLTNIHVRVFEVQLNNYTKVIDISKYDDTIYHLYPLYQDNKLYLICLGSNNLVVYDLVQGKIQRVQYRSDDGGQGTMYQLKGKEVLGFKNTTTLHLLQHSDFDALFV